MRFHAPQQGARFKLRRMSVASSTVKMNPDAAREIHDLLFLHNLAAGDAEKSIGKEQSAVMLLDKLGLSLSLLDSCMPFKARSMLRSRSQLLERPPSELGLLRIWPSLASSGNRDLDWMEIARNVLVNPKERAGQAFTHAWPGQGTTQFPEPEEINDWQSALNEMLHGPSDAVSKAFMAFTIVVMCHPLADGNGRLARAAFWAPFAQEGLRGPVLPIGLIMYENASWLSSAHRLASLTQDGDELMQMYSYMILPMMCYINNIRPRLQSEGSESLGSA